MQKKDKIQLVSEETGISVRELNRLNQDFWYHGTTVEGAESIKKHGVIAYYNLGSELDFGPGFYMTDTCQRAISYISRLPLITLDGNIQKRKEWTVVEFYFNPFELLFGGGQYSYRNFPKHNDEFANFVFRNRMSNTDNENPHNYDVIWGVMTDNNPVQIIADCKDNVISKETALERLQKTNSMRQLYIGNQKICDMLNIKAIIKEGN